jgi:polysaccharide biosynthesis transport protein
MAIAAAFGVVIGLLLVYVRELTDASFHSGDDVRNVLGLPCLGLIPHITRRDLSGAAVEDYAGRKPFSPLAEQLRSLRAGLSLSADRPRSIAVTGARPHEGKTTVARALARLAAINGERVIVVDCDVRHSSTSRGPDGNPLPGIIDCLEKRATLMETIQRDMVSGVDFLPSGQGEANVLGLLTSETMARLLQALRQEYDLVLLDTPPAEAITDARIIAGLADATLLCIRWRATSHQTALHALERLEAAQANVVGVALTQVDIHSHSRSGYPDSEVYHPRYGAYFRR